MTKKRQPEPAKDDDEEEEYCTGGRARRRKGGKAEGVTEAKRLDQRKRGGGKWIQGAIKHPGALHEQLHVPQGEKIPEKKLEKAAHSENPTLRRRAKLAETLKGFH
jgi:hypothetical protein